MVNVTRFTTVGLVVFITFYSNAETKDKRFLVDTYIQGSIYAYCYACYHCLCGPELFQGECSLLKTDVYYKYNCKTTCQRTFEECQTTTTMPQTTTTGPHNLNISHTQYETTLTTKATATTTKAISIPTGASPCHTWKVFNYLVKHIQANDTNGETCADGSSHTSQALLSVACDAPPPAKWHKDSNVNQNCSALPTYTPVGTFYGSDKTSDFAAVLISCLDNGFEIIAQTCDSVPQVYKVTDQSSHYNVDDFFVIRW